MTTELLLDHLTKQLRIPTISAQYRSLAREAENRNLSYEEFLLALLEAESESREENQRQRRLKQAAFPVQKTLDSYDFSLMPSLNRNRFLTLSKGDFVEKKENIIFLGNSGTGKSHLATGIGIDVVTTSCRPTVSVKRRPSETARLHQEAERAANAAARGWSAGSGCIARA